MRPRPKVSVCMITYQHEDYIAQAIESVLAQRTDFPVELVIGEDNSPDATAAVLGRYASTGNVELRPRFNNPNLGMMRNFEQTLNECRGDYIALLEGDDYWTVPTKLQRQADFLDRQRDFAICFHPVDVLQGGRLRADDRTRAVPAVTDIHDLAQGNYMHTCSVMFRARLFASFPPTYTAATAGDYFLHMLNARFGRIGRLDDKMAVYRVHDGGAWSGDPDIDLKILAYLECMIGVFDEDINERLRARHRHIAFEAFVRRIDEVGVDAHFERCVRYGTAGLAPRIAALIEQAKAGRSNAVLRLLRLAR